jgi:membrane-bound ClpP family serine protease
LRLAKRRDRIARPGQEQVTELNVQLAGKNGRTTTQDKREEPFAMLATIAIVLFVLWLLGVVAFKVTAFAIHLLLIAAVVMLVLHFVRGRTA